MAAGPRAGGPAAPTVVLLLHGPAGPPRSAVARPGATLVGRAPHADVRLEDPEVSGDHLQLSLHGRTLLAVDLDSSNGTSLNGRPLLRATRLRDGDVLALGAHRLEVRFAGAADDDRAAQATRPARRGLPHLTDDERAVARELVAPLRAPGAVAPRPATRAQIAERLAVSERTVQRRIDALATRLGVAADAGPDRPRLVAERVLAHGLDRPA